MTCRGLYTDRSVNLTEQGRAVYFTSSEQVMQGFASSPARTVLGCLIAAAVIGLNVLLIVLTVKGDS